ncbi:MAG: polyprenol monophosphomannose synthase [Flavobacteriales bacterium]
MSESLVIIPTYEEAENIDTVLDAVLALPQKFCVLVVDDNSLDGTAQRVAEKQGAFPNRLFLAQRAAKKGLGAAYLHGFRWALERSYEFIFEMDADWSHNPTDLPKLLSACEKGADLAIGSRYSNGVNVVNWPMKRVLLSYFASKYVRFMTGMPLHDATAGFICYNRRVLESIDLNKIRFVGYAFQIEMKYKAWRKGFALSEIPIVFTDRTLGESKLSKAIFWEAFFGVITLRIHSLFNSD